MPFTEKRLAGPTQLTTSASAIYTVPANKTTIVKQIIATNTSASAATFTLYIGAASVGNAVFSGTSVAANESLVINTSQVLSTGEILRALASANTAINLTISGVENDGPLTPTATYIADNAITTAKLADSSVTTEKIAAGAVVTADLAANAVTQAKLDTAIPLSGMRNAVINGNMSIWQRGTSFTWSSGQPYTADRWGITPTTSAAFSASRQSTGLDSFQYCLRLQRTAANTSTASLYVSQPIETVNSIQFQGKQVTLSFYARAGANYSATSSLLNVRLATGTGTDGNFLVAALTGQALPIDTTVTLTSSWQRFTVSGTVASTANQVQPAFYFTPTGTAGAADFFEITGIQLEQGSQVTPFEQRPYGVELALCQRYYEKSFVGTAPASSGLTSFAGSVSGSNGLWIAGVQFKVTKRDTPNITTYDNNNNAGKITTWSGGISTDNISAQTNWRCNAEGFACYYASGVNGIWFGWVAEKEL